MEKKNTFVIQLEAVEMPKIIESTSQGWVRWGRDNLWPNYLGELLNYSAVHNGIVTSKVDYVIGELFESDDETTNEIVNSEEIRDIFTRCAFDLVVTGGYALKVYWSRESIANQKVKVISKIEHVPVEKTRAGIKDENGKIEGYWFSRDWKYYRKKENEPVFYPSFNPDDKKGVQIYFYNSYRPGMDYYPLPGYIGALPYIEVDKKISQFHLNHISSGFFPNIHMTFTNGMPEEEQKRDIVRSIRSAFTGVESAGKIVIDFVDDKDQAPIINPINIPRLDQQFLQLQESTMQNILTGHSVTSPLLVGIKTPGQLGGNQELKNAYEIFLNGNIIPLQEKLLRTFNKVFELMRLQEVMITQTTPINFTYSENILSRILTMNELRESIGYEPLEGSDTIEPTTPTTPTTPRRDEQEEFSKIELDDDDIAAAPHLDDLDAKYIWVLGDEEDPCPACLDHSTKTARPLREWLGIAVPRTPNGINISGGITKYKTDPYGTFCEDNCRCDLVKVN